MANDLKETLEQMQSRKNTKSDVARDRFEDDRHTGSFESHSRPQLPKDPPPPK